ncbi:MAG: hypothetical protein A3K54_00140 [Omnitrophica WOR_2 bacterium RBG_13_44_8]|nr:MAG: hypothetical protein A3K54_00140 [Omnitrophica WOR_2 bacterium RBG_13_44_8]
MSHPLKKQIEELSDQARDYERWLYDNFPSPDWDKKVSEYHGVLFRLAQRRQESFNEGKIISYTPLAHLPRIINRSENVTR